MMKHLAPQYRFYSNKNRSSMIQGFFQVKTNFSHLIKALTHHLLQIQNDVINQPTDNVNRLILNWISINLKDLDRFYEVVGPMVRDKSIQTVAFWHTLACLFHEKLDADTPLSALIYRNVWTDKFKESNKYKNNLIAFLNASFDQYDETEVQGCPNYNGYNNYRGNGARYNTNKFNHRGNDGRYNNSNYRGGFGGGANNGGRYTNSNFRGNNGGRYNNSNHRGGFGGGANNGGRYTNSNFRGNNGGRYNNSNHRGGFGGG
eukprot:256792_1